MPLLHNIKGAAILYLAFSSFFCHLLVFFCSSTFPHPASVCAFRLSSFHINPDPHGRESLRHGHRLRPFICSLIRRSRQSRQSIAWHIRTVRRVGDLTGRRSLFKLQHEHWLVLSQSLIHSVSETSSKGKKKENLMVETHSYSPTVLC